MNLKKFKNMRKLIKFQNQLYKGLCSQCRLNLAGYAKLNPKYIKAKDAGSINEDMKDFPVCDKCKEHVRKIMESFKDDK